MSKFLKTVPALIVTLGLIVPATAEQFGLGRPATTDEIAAWNVDVRPDGLGLPVGSGSVLDGEEIFGERCASCHGDFGEGVDRWPVLAGGEGTLQDDRPQKTIGSYWPYLSTLYDYVHRAMPFGEARSLEADEVYAIVAYLLYMNDVVADGDFVLSKENFTDVEMPNAGGFVEDPRPDTKVLAAGEEPCMSDCKPEAKITSVAAVLDVTPDDENNPSGGID
jgi:cytochrome c